MGQSANAQSQTDLRPSIGEFSRSEEKLMLVCGACQRRGKYRVGHILVGPDLPENEDSADSSQKKPVTFSGLFRCKHCGAGGPWTLPASTYSRILVMMMAKHLQNDDSIPVHYGQMAMFDGTLVQCGAQAEDFLKRKVAEAPDDAFLWSRLGNFYDNAGERKPAIAAYERAIEFDPGEIESNYHLGLMHLDNGDREEAADCFQRVAKHAITAPRRNPALLEGIVRRVLGHLFDLYCETDGAIPFPPELPKPPETESESRDPNEPNVVSLIEMDLGTEESWEILTSICLTGRMPERVIQRERRKVKRALKNNPEEFEALADFIGDFEPVKIASPRIQRNDPCPCGSGKKYKRCCGQ